MASKNEIEGHLIEPADDLLIQQLGLSDGYRIEKIHISKSIKKIRVASVINQFPQMILVRGPSGSGKSTLAKSLCAKGYIHVESDEFFIKKMGMNSMSEN